MYKFICYVLNTKLQYVTNTTLRCNYVSLLGCFTSIYPGLALGALVIDASCWEFRSNPCTQVADMRWRRKPDHGEFYHLVDWYTYLWGCNCLLQLLSCSQLSAVFWDVASTDTY